MSNLVGLGLAVWSGVLTVTLLGLWVAAIVLAVRVGSGHLAVSFGIMALLRLLEGSMLRFLPRYLYRTATLRAGFLTLGGLSVAELLQILALVLLVVGLAGLVRKDRAKEGQT